MGELNLLKEQAKEFLLDRYGVNGLVQSDIDLLDFYISEKTHDFINVIYNPSLCIILQGAKSVGFGDEMSGYNEQRYLLTSIYTPLRVSITDASKERPYISLSLKFSMDEIYEVLKNVEIKDDNMQKSQKGVFFGDLTEEILEPVLRFILLLEKPKEKIKFLSDLAKKEILYTLVTSDKSGYFLTKFAMQGSVSNKILNAVAKIKNEFSQKLNMKEVARLRYERVVALS